MSEFNPSVGIDLGTTFSAIAYINEHDRAVVIPNQEGGRTTPSVIKFYNKDTFVVGDEAVNRLIADEKNTVSFIKRRMGDPGYKRNIHGEDYSPQKISALILSKLKRDAEKFFLTQGRDVTVKDVVITVPAYFGMEQKGATQEACELAGLNVLQIINEPIAAVLAYGINKLGKDQTVFVFDLGGGTFDVTILEVKENEIHMIASDGSPELGGKDWDDALVSYCSTVFKEKYGEDPRNDSNSYQEMYERVLKSKITLSYLPKAIIQVSHIGKRDNIKITREKFEDISKDLLAQCKSLSEQVLEKAGKNWSNIDTILLVGGSTYMPMVRGMINEISGKEPSTEVKPDECVAVGAAWMAYYNAQLPQPPHHYQESKCCEEYFKIRQEEESCHKSKMVEIGSNAITEETSDSSGLINKIADNGNVILPNNIGLSVNNSEGKKDVVILFQKGTQIPLECNESFSIAFDGQVKISLTIMEGNGNDVDDYWKIGDIFVEFNPKKRGDFFDVSINIPSYGIMNTQFSFENEKVSCETKLNVRKESDFSYADKLADFKKIDKFIMQARLVDTFENCNTVYDLFRIKDKFASYSDIEKSINEFINRYGLRSSPKYKFIGKIICVETERIRKVLREYRFEYNDYINKNNPVVLKIKEYFDFITKRNYEINPKEKENLIEEGKERGLIEADVRSLISSWIREGMVKEI